jgi:hypothetical protein
MLESDTYLAILEEGAVREVRKLIFLLGQKKFGPPMDDMVNTVQSIEDLERLERIFLSHPEVSSWQELLQVP